MWLVSGGCGPPGVELPSLYRMRGRRLKGLAAVSVICEQPRDRRRGGLLELAAADRSEPRPTVKPMLTAVNHEMKGELTKALGSWQEALSQSPDGIFDCVAASEISRLFSALGDETKTKVYCDRVTKPPLPMPYCLALRERCL